MTNKIIAIHQPNFFPWLGYFYKISRCDEFVLLDHVAMNPRTSINPKRVRIICNRNEHWLTVPLKNKKGETFVPICKMEIDNPSRLAKKHLKTIELNYKNTPFYDEIMPVVINFYEHPSIFISERNISFIKAVAVKLEINASLIKSSSMVCTDKSTKMLIEIIKNLKGNIYLSGNGASGYQENEIYSQNNIELQFSNFQYPIYPQCNTEIFMKGLSIIDALMNLGFQGVKQLLTISSLVYK